MKTLRTYRITSIILMICCAGMLIHSNYQKNRNAEIVDQYFDLQEEYTKIFDNIQELEDYSERLEEQVDILSNFISPADWIEIDSLDTTIE
jgi:ligand-binding sensor protein